jgi:hypothetical protein
MIIYNADSLYFRAAPAPLSSPVRPTPKREINLGILISDRISTGIGARYVVLRQDCTFTS